MKIVVRKDNSLQYEATVLDDDLINGGELFIGRNDDCHVILDSLMISRHHAVVKFEDQQLHIETLSNLGNIKIDGKEMSSGIIQNGSKVEVNEFFIEFDDFSYITTRPDISNVADEFDSTELMATPLAEEESPVVDEFSDDDADIDVMDSDDNLLDSQDFPDEEELETETLDETESLNYEDEPLSEDSLEDNFDNDTVSDGGASDESDFSDDDNAEVENELDNDLSDEMNNEADDFGDDFSGEDDFAGGDDFEGGFDDGDEKTQVLSSFASYSLRIFGEYAPFDTYKLDDAVTNIGRDTAECQIVLTDPEVSKVHAIIRKTLISCIIEDNGSSNGIILNGERVNKAELTTGDEFIIGETTFTVVISSDIIDSEKGRLMPVEENQEIIIEDDSVADMDFNEGEEGLNLDNTEIIEEKSFIKKIMNDPKKKRIAIFVLVGFAILFLMDSPEPTKKEEKKDAKAPVAKKTGNSKTKHSPEKLQILATNYNLAMSKFQDGQFHEAKQYIDIVKKIDPNYELTASLDKSIQDSLDLIVRKKEEEEAKKERLEKLKRINKLVKKAKEAVAERKAEAAKSYFASIYELDPENIDVPPLKIEIDSWVEEQARIKQEKELAIAKRKAMVDKLSPGKAEYLKGEWYNAINLLQRFLSDKTIDEDLLKEATNMLKNSQKKLVEFIDPLRSRARSYKEGQDLKMAYETYGELLKFDPGNEEALNEREAIFEALQKRSKKVYREGLIKEDLSDFAHAKEKFQEVQQISPINSEYYIKATDKLKNYLE